MLPHNGRQRSISVLPSVIKSSGAGAAPELHRCETLNGQSDKTSIGKYKTGLDRSLRGWPDARAVRRVRPIWIHKNYVKSE